MTYVSVQDLLNWLGGTVTGSTCYMWELTIPSGSINDHIIYGEHYLHNILGDTRWNATTDYTSGSLRQLIRNYVSFRVLVVLTGGIITEGFLYRTGMPIERPQLLSTLTSMIESFKSASEGELMKLQDIVVYAEADQPAYGKTAPPVM